MDIEQLKKKSDDDIINWVRNESKKYTLIADHELEEIITARDHWEEQATQLSQDVAEFFDDEVGEHSNCNNPVNNAFTIIGHHLQEKSK